MFFVRRKSGYKMVLNTTTHDEIESYTLIHLNDIEKELFLREAGLSKFNGVKTIDYESNGPLDKLFKRFADEHRKNNSNFNTNVGKKVVSKKEGNWCLVRNPDVHTIALKPRSIFGDESNYDFLNRLCIDSKKVSQFCSDCNKTGHSGKYYLNLRKDGWLYNYWSNYMNYEYKKNIKRIDVWKL